MVSRPDPLTCAHRAAYGPRKMRASLTVGVIVGVLVGAITPVRADVEEVERLIAKANELRQQGNPWQALAYYQKAYELQHTPRTTGQLGVGELAAGYPVEASEHLAMALRSPKHPWVAKYKGVLEETMAKARARIGEVAIEGKLEGATVSINGHKVGNLPLASNVKVAAGNVDIVVHSDGYADFKRTIEVAGGGHERVVADLVKTTEAPAGTSAAKEIAWVSASQAGIDSSTGTVVAEHPTPRGTSLRQAGFISGGGAVAALATGGALQLMAMNKIHGFNAGCSLDFNGRPVSKATMTATGQCSSAYDTSSSEKQWSTITYVVGGSLAVMSGILIWWSYHGRGDRTPEQHARLSCVPGPMGVACGGIFCEEESGWRWWLRCVSPPTQALGHSQTVVTIDRGT